jgi:hypothetical protein
MQYVLPKTFLHDKGLIEKLSTKARNSVTPDRPVLAKILLCMSACVVHREDRG